MIARDFLCGGSRTNRKAVEKHADFAGVDEDRIWLACDAQTSGGLLIAVGEDEADALMTSLKEAGIEAACFVGKVTAEHPGKLVMRP